jgi:hypothetical protein
MTGPAILAVALAVAVPQSADRTQKALHAVEWTDPAGDVTRGNTSSGTRPGFDIVKLGIVSDGTTITVNATLKGPMSGDWGSDVVTLYIDTDNNPATGYKTFWSNIPGFELKASLLACVDYADGAQACVGSMKGAKVKGYHAVATVGKMIDTSGNTDDIVGTFKAVGVPIQGAVVSAKLTYKDLGVKPGQTIRLVARETDGPSDATADFPVVRLTLK